MTQRRWIVGGVVVVAAAGALLFWTSHRPGGLDVLAALEPEPGERGTRPGTGNGRRAGEGGRLFDGGMGSARGAVPGGAAGPREGAAAAAGGRPLVLDPEPDAVFVPPTPEELAGARLGSEPVVPTADELANSPFDGYWGPNANQVTRACQHVARRIIEHGGREWYDQVVDACDDESGLSKEGLMELCENLHEGTTAQLERQLRVHCNVGPPENPGTI